MKYLIIYPALAAVMFAGACKSSKESAVTADLKPGVLSTEASPATASNPNTLSSATTHEETNVQNDEKHAANMYRLIISFISIGEGTDQNARPIMDGVLSTWEKKKGVAIAHEDVPWGREGEVDFCFILKELSPKEQETFVNDMKTAFKGHSLVQISENQRCTHKR